VITILFVVSTPESITLLLIWNWSKKNVCRDVIRKSIGSGDGVR
jgi:hypothetical protein